MITMQPHRRTVKVIALLLYAILFIGCEWFFLQHGHRYSMREIPFLYALVITATMLAIVLTFLEQKKFLLWALLTHLQFLLCFNPVVLHLITAVEQTASKEPLSLQRVGAGFMMGIDGYLLTYVMLPLNAVCVIGYYIWAARENQ